MTVKFLYDHASQQCQYYVLYDYKCRLLFVICRIMVMLCQHHVCKLITCSQHGMMDINHRWRYTLTTVVILLYANSVP
jgi:hypothetical protein